MDELRSLLDNFKNLSKAEQKDLIQYMRKLEATNPAKVQQLKRGVGGGGGGGGGGGSGEQPGRALSPLAQRSLEGGSNLSRPVGGPGSDVGRASTNSGSFSGGGEWQGGTSWQGHM